MNKEVKLEEIVEFVSGFAFSSSKFTLERKEESIPVIRIQNVNSEDSDFVYWEHDYKEQFVVKDGDILLSMSGDFKVNKWTKGMALLNQRVVKITPKKNVHVDYLLFLINSKIKELTKLGKKSIINNLSIADLKSLKVKIPDYATQEKISINLSICLKLINKRQSQIAALDELAHSVFLKMFHKDTSIVCKIKDIADIKTGSTPKRDKADYWINGTIPWVKTGEVNMNYIYESQEKITELAFKESSLDLLPKNTILIAMYGQGVTRGRVGMLRFPATTNQACAAIIPHNQVNPYFLFKQLEMNYQKLRSLGRGGNQPNLNLSIVSNFEVMIPELKKQDEYNDFYYKIDQQKSRFNNSLSYFFDLYNSLLQKAFQGELF